MIVCLTVIQYAFYANKKGPKTEFDEHHETVLQTSSRSKTKDLKALSSIKSGQTFKKSILVETKQTIYTKLSVSFFKVFRVSERLTGATLANEENYKACHVFPELKPVGSTPASEIEIEKY